MPSNSYEIRLCNSCGLRYPLTAGHPHGARCPACTGETRVLLNRQLFLEPKPDHLDISNRRIAKHAKTKTIKEGKKKASLRHLDTPEDSNTLAVLLDNIRSAWNAGSILRSADGFGFNHAYFCGITPTPENEAVTKTSLGAEDTVPWSYHKDAVKLVMGLKKEGWKVYVLEDDARAVKINHASSSISLDSTSVLREVLVVGNEVTGVDPELLDLCDAIYCIPMRGEKKSFNVAIAFGIAAYALK